MHAWEALNAMSACSQVFDECGDDLYMHAAERLRSDKGYDELMMLARSSTCVGCMRAAESLEVMHVVH